MLSINEANISPGYTLNPLFWTSSPLYFNNTGNLSPAYGNLSDNEDYLTGLNGIRPVISLKSGTLYSDGDGSRDNPYYVGDVYSITNSNNLLDK